MIFIGIALMVMVMSVQCFTLTYRINGINRTLLETPVSLFETSIPVIQDEGEFEAYFNKSELKKQLTYYYDTSLTKYVTDYQISYLFSKAGSPIYCLASKCDAIEIKIKAKIIYFTNYTKSMRFEIRRVN